LIMLRARQTCRHNNCLRLSSLRSPQIGSAPLAIAEATDGFAAREATTQAAMIRCEVLRNRAFMVPLRPKCSSPISRLR
jgi:hypothetical protein